MDRALELLPATFNAEKKEVHFGPSTSQNTYVLAQALRPAWKTGDEIIVTNQDHEANVGCWRSLSRESRLTTMRSRRRSASLERVCPVRPRNRARRLVGRASPRRLDSISARLPGFFLLSPAENWRARRRLQAAARPVDAD